MTSERWRSAVLILATLTMGLVSGAFVLYSHTVMPGLHDTDDHTFVAAFQSMDKAIINPVFMLGGFLGALIFTALAVAMHLRGDGRPVLPWLIAALVLYVIVVGITFGVNVPANDDLKAAGDPDHIANLAAVRDQFNETKWSWWNHVRSVLSTAAFGCLIWALIEHGRTLRPLPRMSEQGSASWSSRKVSP
jgi:uncharacterized membrane protein